MKKLCLLLEITALTFVPSFLFGFSGSGSGTKVDPYQITNESLLQEMKDDLDAHYVLMNDIDASDTENWNSGNGFDPIGTYIQQGPTYGFTGSFNGQEYTISGLYINRTNESYVGLFGCIANGGHVYDVNIEDADVTGELYVGIIVGSTYAYSSSSVVSIEGCSVGGAASGDSWVGGFCGRNEADRGEASISDCFASVAVTGTGYSYFGGFCAYNYTELGTASISNCYATGNASGDNSVGGFCGRNNAEGASKIANASITHCYATGDVSGTFNVGGFCGANDSEYSNANAFISKCYATGNANGSSNVGGFCGLNDAESGTASISDCYAIGNATAIVDIGGFCGENFTTNASALAKIDRCYSIGVPSGNNSVGGFCGDQSGGGIEEINNSFWDTETSGYQISDGGTGKTTSQMKTQSNFLTWDFDDVWALDVDMNEGYPNLQEYLTTETINITLSTGWNMISSYVIPKELLMDSVFKNIVGNILIVKNGEGKIFVPSFDINTIGDWDILEGYQVYASQNTILSISGEKVQPENTSNSLNIGWNMVSYLRDSEMNAETALTSLTNDNKLLIAKDSKGKIYVPSFNINTIGNMKPTQGYQMYLTAPDQLIYPAND